MAYGKEPEEIVMVFLGSVQMLTSSNERFMQLPPGSIFNDYQLLYNLKSNINFKSESITFESERQYNNAEHRTQTMNLDGEKFRELITLYPDTCENLKLRSLEKRSIFMYYKNKVMQRKN